LSNVAKKRIARSLFARSVFAFLLVAFLFFCSLSVSCAESVTREELNAFLKETLAFQPAVISEAKENPLTRYEAVETILRAMGYDYLASFLTEEDLRRFGKLEFPAESREAKVSVLATLLSPPLLKGDAEGKLRLFDFLTRKEFEYLKERLKNYQKEGVHFEYTREVEPGLTLKVYKEGLPGETAGEGVFLQVGAFSDEEKAKRVSQWLKELNYSTSVQLEDGLFKVRVGPVDKEELSLTASRLKKQGFNSFPVYLKAGKPGPLFSLALLFDPQKSKRSIFLALAQDQLLERETLSSLARRKGALFGINAGFFTPDGIPIGLLMIDGKILREPQEGWFVCGFTPQNEMVIGEVVFKAEVITSKGYSFPVSGINRKNRGEELVLYTPEFGPQTPEQKGVECIVRSKRIFRIGTTQGKTSIEPDTIVLQGQGRGASWMLENLKPGEEINLKITLAPRSGDPEIWKKVNFMISGGPLLFREGRKGPFGDFRQEIVEKEHPRTVIGKTSRGEILFLVVDGRNPRHSQGLTINQLVNFLEKYQVTDALNLDGGGSVAFYLQGKVLNFPSDPTGERKISTALLLR